MEASSLRSQPLVRQETNKIIRDIYHRYNAGLNRYLKRRLNSLEDVQDINQEVYLRLLKNSNLQELNPSLGLLKKIASDLISEKFRKKSFRAISAQVPIDDLEIKAPELSPEKLLQEKQGVDLINGIIKSLNKNSRRAFLLNRFKRLTYQDIAKKMGISRSMVQKHISHVLDQLRMEIEKHDEKTK